MTESHGPPPPPLSRRKHYPKPTITVAEKPTPLTVSYIVEKNRYDLPNFVEHLGEYFEELPSIRKSTSTRKAPDFLHVWQRIKFTNPNIQLDSAANFFDTAIASPPRSSSAKSAVTVEQASGVCRGPRLLPARYDPILVHDYDANPEVKFGIQMFKVGILKLIFAIPPDTLAAARVKDPGLLAYVEWLKVDEGKDEASGMYGVSRVRNFESHEIIEVGTIHRPCHLIPDFGEVCDTRLTAETVLYKHNKFWLNNYIDALAFQELY
ncbi:hypothetical protein SISSUDRAFT_1036800 [Sistotremastrum suecicum HHB10207 ss-3]|uniref:Uncharacterized protein n=1 Tax=Sistotremastrum suecicum HHB10207 ss-3 TaxID=1314776 RepID=A0A165YZW7_9AGAM|nr:hypothetical protein SISSUDRAFT_1036800 [Sistotremastrum suecicum HHB10207 ss-3]